MKRTNVSVCLALLVASFSNVQCGGEPGLDQPGDASTGPGGPAGTGGQGGSATGGSGGGGGFGGSVLPDGSSPHPCPLAHPADGSHCSERNSCKYADGVCSCIRAEGADASGRVWSCFDTVPRDSGVCPKDPQEGESCLIPGLSCPAPNAAPTCTCVAADGSLQWRC